HFRANNIVALDEAKWTYPDAIDFEEYRLVGLAGERVRVESGTILIADFPSLTIQPAVLGVTKKELKDCPAPIDSEWPWFVGYVEYGLGVNDISGMSGGPIFGLRIRDDEIHYRIAAIQSRWWPSSRIILGCPVPILLTTITHLMSEAVAKGGQSLENTSHEG